MLCLPPSHMPEWTVFWSSFLISSWVKVAVQYIVTNLGDADRYHFCDSTWLAPPQAFPAVEQQLAVEPCQTSSLAVYLPLLYPGIDTVESSGVLDVRCSPRGHSISLRGGHN